MDVRITLLGGFEVAVAGTPVPSAQWRRRHAAALVKILALVPGRRLHREQLIDTLWPELTVEEAAPRLHKAAHYARRAMGHPDSVVLAGEMVALWPDEDVQVDAAVFQAQAETALAARDAAAAGSVADRYRGDLLPEDPYESWAQEVRDRLRMLYLDLLRLAGRWEVLTVVDPADERAHLEVIAALARVVTGVPRCVSSRGWSAPCGPNSASHPVGPRRSCASGCWPKCPPDQRRPRNSPRPSLQCSILSAGIGSANDSKDWSLRCPPVTDGRCSSVDRPVSERPRSSRRSKGTVPQRVCGSGVVRQRRSRVPGRMRRCWRRWPTCAVVTRPCSTDWTTRSGRKSNGRCPDGKPPGGRRAATNDSSWRSRTWSGWPRPERVRCWSSTTPTTPMTPAPG